MRHLSASACDDECRRAQRCKVSRSSVLRMIGTVGRPRRAKASSFCQGFYLTERASAAKVPDQPIFCAKQAYRTLELDNGTPPPGAVHGHSEDPKRHRQRQRGEAQEQRQSARCELAPEECGA